MYIRDALHKYFNVNIKNISRKLTSSQSLLEVDRSHVYVTISVHRYNVNRYFGVPCVLKASPKVFSMSVIYASSYYRNCTRALPF